MSDRRLRLRASRLARDESGIGLIELMIALTLIAIGVGAALSVFASSIVSLQHGAREGTALTLADRQVEAYRSMSFACLPTSLTSGVVVPVGPDPGCATVFDTPDPRDPPTCRTVPATCNPHPFPNPYAATQTVSKTVSPDHRSYTVITDVTANSPYCGNTATQVIVSVNQVGNSTVLARESSCFSNAGNAAGT
jgi:type II secretory pathway pseudopilin PulG